MRTCQKCKETKKDTCLYKRKDRESGFFFTCKECYSNWRKAKYIKNKYKEREYENKRRLTIPRRYQKLKSRAKTKNIILTITENEYALAIKSPCFYYNNKLCTPSTDIGLDRIDPNKGYELKIIVSCCGFCNTIKMDLLSLEEMKKVANLIIIERKL
jgi:hypothetical protein